jgi:N-acetylglucosamine-6-phosphate deacetylase
VTALVLQAGAVVTPAGTLSPGWVAVEDTCIAALGEGRWHGSGQREATLLDVGSRIVAAGFVDVHVHGGDGAQVNGSDPSEVAAAVAHLARFHARHGTTSLLATTVADTPERLLATVTGIRRAAEAGTGLGARLAGIHLEGPWLARAKMGAQDPAGLRPPDAGELRALSDAAGGLVRLVTVAPELPGAPALIAAALELGAKVAIGHTDASYETAVAAIEAGATHATHLFNAMAPLHHRMPGAVTALLLDEWVTLEVIADLEHIHPAVLRLVARLAPDRLVAVSDAVTAAGLLPGTYELGRFEIEVAGGRAVLASDPRTLAGSMLTMDEAVRNLVRVVGLSLEDALGAATSAPARAAGIESTGAGRLEVGMPADLVVLEDDLAVGATLVGGEAVFDGMGCFWEVAVG